jgi:hypothetical protein
VIFSMTLLFASSGMGQAGARSSVNYAITSESMDTGGMRAVSANYTIDASGGGPSSSPPAASASYALRSSYAGQLYEVTALQLTAVPASIQEGETRQLLAKEVLDDSSELLVSSSSVAWSVQSGPVTGISSDGLATAGSVYTNTHAQVKGVHGGREAMLGLTVVDFIKDNFGSYASDGVGDDWQVQYFGLNNPAAGPAMISDGSGHSNLFKFTAGLIPFNAASRFLVSTSQPVGQPGARSIFISPTFADRSYKVYYSTDLSLWQLLEGPFSGSGGATTIIDPVAGTRRFYRVTINKP